MAKIIDFYSAYIPSEWDDFVSDPEFTDLHEDVIDILYEENLDTTFLHLLDADDNDEVF